MSRVMWGIVLSLSFQYGCAALHKVQLSDLEKPPQGTKSVSIKVSQDTVNLRELSQLLSIAGKSSGSKATSSAGKGVSAYRSLFQFGPKTGTPVFNETYARDIAERMVEKCPNGRITNITSIRESREYPVLKGEIIRIDGDCVKSRGAKQRR